MAKKYIRDFTEGSIAAHLLAFAAPMLFGNIFQEIGRAHV